MTTKPSCARAQRIAACFPGKRTYAYLSRHCAAHSTLQPSCCSHNVCGMLKEVILALFRVNILRVNSSDGGERRCELRLAFALADAAVLSGEISIRHQLSSPKPGKDSKLATLTQRHSGDLGSTSAQDSALPGVLDQHRWAGSLQVTQAVNIGPWKS